MYLALMDIGNNEAERRPCKLSVGFRRVEGRAKTLPAHD